MSRAYLTTAIKAATAVQLGMTLLTQGSLRCADLEGAHLRGAHLRGADLRGMDLEGTNLCGAHLRGANLRGANLRRADLRQADLRCADLEGTNLCGVDLRGADLRGANLEGADLGGVMTRPYHSDLAVERWVAAHPDAMVTVEDGLHEATRAANALVLPRDWESDGESARRYDSYDVVSRAMRRHGVPWSWEADEADEIRRIATLRVEASQAGDAKLASLCDAAIAGDSAARAECERVLAEASAQY